MFFFNDFQLLTITNIAFFVDRSGSVFDVTLFHDKVFTYFFVNLAIPSISIKNWERFKDENL